LNGALTSFWTIDEWQAAYSQGASPIELLSDMLARLPSEDAAWISRISSQALEARLRELARQFESVGRDPSNLPLFGIPFAVKDNIDVAGFPTTCACPQYAYRPVRSATVIERLQAAGAVVVGKTNLDQFATGLVGTRSPYGAVPNAFAAHYITGGSSSGSASVVTRGFVPFALGTDTAGSGRVPAGHSNLVGLKPTRGLISMAGVVPACRTLDCVSILALSVDDANVVLQASSGFDVSDAYSRCPPTRPAAWPMRPVLGIPDCPQWFGDPHAEPVYRNALRRLQSLGIELRPVDFTVLFETAALLYEGPWVAERYTVVEELLRTRPDALHPVVRGIIEQSTRFTAADAYRAEYRRAALARRAEALMKGLDGLLVPTTPGIHTIAEVLADPVRLNSRMGVYTNFVNLLDWSAIAVPAGVRADGLPAGITLIAPGWHEARLLEFGRRWQAAAPWTRGVSNEELPPPNATTPVGDRGVTIAVVGAHLSGMPLNHQLTELGAVLRETTRTAAAYRLYALRDTTPPKPGLLRAANGASIAVELWSMPVECLGSFVALIPPPLCLGSVELIDGRIVRGFVCESWATGSAEDITALGGWRAYIDRGR
jgi:allophanate hydrolase